MQNRINRSIATFLFIAGVTAFSAGCASMKAENEQKEEEAATRVSLAQMSAPARATVESLTAGGQVHMIDKEVERRKVVYDVEATVGGKQVEYMIADVDGAVLGTETSIEYSELPGAVRAAAEEHFGGATGLKVMKGVEYGQTSYEIEGIKNGKTEEVTFDSTGKRAEEEKE